MLMLRLVMVLTAIAIGAGILAFLFTRDRRYLALAWRITRWAIIFAFVVMSLFALERVAVMI